MAPATLELARRFGRPALYGGLVALIAAFFSVESRLAAAAAAAQQPPSLPVIHSGAVGRERLFDLLQRTGASSDEAQRIARAAGTVLNLRGLDATDRYTVVRSEDGALRHFTLLHGLKRVAVVGRPDGSLRAVARAVPPIPARRAAAGTIRGSLWASMESRGVPPEVIMLFADTFQWTVDFVSEPRDGDRFSVVWTEGKGIDGRLHDRRIEAALYDGSASGENRALLHDGHYYDEKGESLQRMFLRAPLSFARVSSRFTRRRFHPVLRISRPHHGTDYSAARGTPVIAVAGGRVTVAGRQGGYGNLVRVRHSDTYTTGYAHLSRLGAGVRAGSYVRQGQVIGYVGATGLATGPHLHFEIAKNGRPVDFLRLDLPFARRVLRAHRESFKARKDAILAELLALPRQ